MVAEVVSGAVLFVASGAELLHSLRVRRLAPLAFGPSGKPAFWTVVASPLRVLALAVLAWGLVTLLGTPAKVRKAQNVGEQDLRHIVLVLDVSPSMKIEDAGSGKTESRARRAYVLMESFFKRIVMDQFRLSLIAVYSDAKPVVVGTKDAEVVHNFLDGLDMYQAFKPGKTKLFEGLSEAFKVAAPWRARSTTVILLTDGDTVPATGMPEKSRSVDGVLVVGIGDPKISSFIDGRQSKQDASTLRQIALRLGGTYHDGNDKHLPTDLVNRLTSTVPESPFRQLTRREYALIACVLGTSILAFLPFALHRAGTRWKPGVRAPAERG